MKRTFTLRDLFWLVLVCAMAIGWWIDRSRLDSLFGPQTLPDMWITRDDVMHFPDPSPP
jgi:hypothetical protein